MSASRYEILNPGDVLQDGDEYSIGPNIWHRIPEFLVGDVIEASNTQWRRLILEETGKPEKKKKKKWFGQ